MATKKPKSKAPSRKTPSPPRQRVGGGKVDDLGVVRGQNAEKVGTVRPEHVRDEGVISH